MSYSIIDNNNNNNKSSGYCDNNNMGDKLNSNGDSFKNRVANSKEQNDKEPLIVTVTREAAGNEENESKHADNNQTSQNKPVLSLDESPSTRQSTDVTLDMNKLTNSSLNLSNSHTANKDSNNNSNNNDNSNNNNNKSNSKEADSTSTCDNNNTIMCRICHCEETSEEFLITPCFCSGSLRYVHQSCLQKWIKTEGIKACELCKFEFIMQAKIRPLKNWKKLHMGNIERRRILCLVTFHIIAIVCVIWSLYVLIDRTAQEIRTNNFDWSFWIKLVIVAFGFTGGIVFMYLQCKMYLSLCRRWRLYNHVILIQPITEEIIKNAKKLNSTNNTNNNNNNFLSSNNNSKSDRNKNGKINEEISGGGEVVLNLSTDDSHNQTIRVN